MKINTDKVLSTSPKKFRTPVCFASAPAISTNQSNGINGVSLTTRGEALGHGVWLDSQFLQQVNAAAQEAENGVKSRFTHPSMSGDGLGSYVGRVSNTRVSGDQVVGDLQFSDAARNSPGKGDLVSYITQLAKEDPTAFGMSIVYEPDQEAEMLHFIQHGGVVTQDEDGITFDSTNFQSPDPDNVDNLPHARLAVLCTVDFVDEPAANPGGVFSRGQNLPIEADALASYALGLATDKPELVQLSSLDADRVRGFIQRFLTSHKLEVRKMADATVQDIQNDEIETDAVVENEVVGSEAVESESPEYVAAAELPAESVNALIDDVAAAQEYAASKGVKLELGNPRNEIKRYITAFGTENGTKWYLEEISFDAARDLHIGALDKTIASLKAELAAQKAANKLLAGEDSPVAFTPVDENKPAKGTLTDKINSMLQK